MASLAVKGLTTKKVNLWYKLYEKSPKKCHEFKSNIRLTTVCDV